VEGERVVDEVPACLSSDDCTSWNRDVAWGVEWLGVGLMVGGITHLRGGIMYRGLFQIGDFFLFCFFFYTHIMLVKVMDVTIFQCVHTFPFLHGM